MKRILKAECKRAFFNKTFYLCLGIGAILCIWLLCIQTAEAGEVDRLIREYGIEKAGLYYPRSLLIIINSMRHSPALAQTQPCPRARLDSGDEEAATGHEIGKSGRL